MMVKTPEAKRTAAPMRSSPRLKPAPAYRESPRNKASQGHRAYPRQPAPTYRESPRNKAPPPHRGSPGHKASPGHTAQPATETSPIFHTSLFRSCRQLPESSSPSPVFSRTFPTSKGSALVSDASALVSNASTSREADVIRRGVKRRLITDEAEVRCRPVRIKLHHLKPGELRQCGIENGEAILNGGSLSLTPDDGGAGCSRGTGDSQDDQASPSPQKCGSTVGVNTYRSSEEETNTADQQPGIINLKKGAHSAKGNKEEETNSLKRGAHSAKGNKEEKTTFLKEGTHSAEGKKEEKSMRSKRECLIDWFPSPEFIRLGFEDFDQTHLCIYCAMRETSLSAALEHYIPREVCLPCKVCKTRWSRPCLERMHNVTAHQFLCYFCPKRFKARHAAIQHRLIHHPQENTPRGVWYTYHGGPPIDLNKMLTPRHVVHGGIVGKLRNPPEDGSSPYIVVNIYSSDMARRQALARKFSEFMSLKNSYISGFEVCSSSITCPFCPFVWSSFQEVEMHMSTSHRPQTFAELEYSGKFENTTMQAISVVTPYCQACNKFFQNDSALKRHNGVVHTISTPYQLTMSRKSEELDGREPTALSKIDNAVVRPSVREIDDRVLRPTQPVNPSVEAQNNPSLASVEKKTCSDIEIIDLEASDDDTNVPAGRVETVNSSTEKSEKGVAGKNLTSSTMDSPLNLEEDNPETTSAKAMAADADGRTLESGQLENTTILTKSALRPATVVSKEGAGSTSSKPSDTTGGQSEDTGVKNESLANGRPESNTILVRPAVVKSRERVNCASWDLPDSLFSMPRLPGSSALALLEVDIRIKKALDDLKVDQWNGGMVFDAAPQDSRAIAAYMKLKPVLDNPPLTPTARRNYEHTHKYKIPMGHFNPEFKDTPLFPTLTDLFVRTKGYKRDPLVVLTPKEVRKSLLLDPDKKGDKRTRKLAKNLSKAIEGALDYEALHCARATSLGHSLHRRYQDMQSHSYLSARITTHLSQRVENRRKRTMNPPPLRLFARGTPTNYHNTCNVPLHLNQGGAATPKQQLQGKLLKFQTTQGQMHFSVNSQGVATLVNFAPTTTTPSQGTSTPLGQTKAPPQTTAPYRPVMLLRKGPASLPNPPKISLPSSTGASQPILPAVLVPVTVSRPQLVSQGQQSSVAMPAPQSLQPPQGLQPPPLHLTQRLAVPQSAGTGKPSVIPQNTALFCKKDEKGKLFTVNKLLAQQKQQQFIRLNAPILQQSSGITGTTNSGNVPQMIALRAPVKLADNCRVVSTTQQGNIPQTTAASRPILVKVHCQPSTSVAGSSGTVSFHNYVRDTIKTALVTNGSSCPPLIQMKPIPQEGAQDSIKPGDGSKKELMRDPPEVIRVSPEKKLVIVNYKDGTSRTVTCERDVTLKPKPDTPLKTRKNIVKLPARKPLSIDWYLHQRSKRKRYEKKWKRQLSWHRDYLPLLKFTKKIKRAPIVTANVMCKAVDADIVMRVSEAVRRGRRARIKLDDYWDLYFKYFVESHC